MADDCVDKKKKIPKLINGERVYLGLHREGLHSTICAMKQDKLTNIKMRMQQNLITSIKF